MAATRPRTAALYHRVSTSDQDPMGPLTELERAARRDGYEALQSITETGSGALNDRPGLEQLMRAVRARKLHAVYVWKLDRFGRSALDLLTQLNELERRRCRFVAVSQGIEFGDRPDPVGRMMLVMLAAVAEFERELIRDRTRQGLRRARDRGVTLGRPSVLLPPADHVRELRARGVYWRDIAKLYRCSVWAAREALEKGGADRKQRLPRISEVSRGGKAC